MELSAQGFMMGDLLAANSVWGEYLKKKGFTREMIPRECPDCYCIDDFAAEHPDGVYVVGEMMEGADPNEREALKRAMRALEQY